ncbi:N utilization substance protein B [Mannheimia granulomatis]|uniref:Transcription antitermination protein NusB n=1 Tax=Mannheimia granulomatis TaxID=85402 RepID=A0A011MKU9_9PAST|nr:transcription antitermination factor NusB [Mannheimia granulomatis]EXI63121.1 transcription antitermination protein NusB [Mannheimia granulomatis]QIM67060.1 N utilization substance protein B [Mannheimia granulomatis]QLB14284.1 N utilization substance protein B [Mannheimia granulomatis]QLB19408.1 N utilization substance protein B [Mannheimia granulomatis]RGE48935.1 transcription antitermination protein NusB [Mannheimia granulomatis]
MKVSPRRRARECAVQAIYSWYISHNTVEEVELAFVTDQDMNGVDMPYFRKLFRGVVNNVEAIDEALRPYLDRNEADIDPIERSILRLSGYELKFEHDVPFRVVINEGIEVAKVFGSDDSHKYINGILDKLAPALGKK